MYNALSNLDIFKSLERELKTASAPLAVSGCMASQKLQLISELKKDYAKILYVTYDEQEAAGAFSDLRNFMDDVWQYPARDLLFFSSDIRSKYLDNQRMDTLRHLLEDESAVAVTTADALMDKIDSKDDLISAKLSLFEGMIIDTSNLSAVLTELGYERCAAVEAMGEYAIRGGIADIYPMASDTPYRIEFFDDEIDTIRSFDTLSQRSVEQIEKIELYPAGEKAGKNRSSGKVSLTDYFDDSSLIVFDDPVRIKERAKAAEQEFSVSFEQRLSRGLAGTGRHTEEDNYQDNTPDAAAEDAFNGNINAADDIFSAEDAVRAALSHRSLLIAGLDESLAEFGAAKSFHFNTAAVGKYKDSFTMLISDILAYQKKGYRISVLTPSRTRTSRLAEELRSYKIKAFCPDEGSEKELGPGETEVVLGSLREGFIYPDMKYALMTESDMFGRTAVRKRRKKHTESGERLSSLNELSVGDYVVHENHGIGIYKGIEHIVRDNVGKDYIKVEYADGGNLYLPATKLDLIQKYASAEAPRPKLNRLNGTEWAKTKSRVTKAVKDIAEELIRLYASRFNAAGYKYGPDTVWQTEFEEMFPYEETEDQANAINAVKADMESSRIMDRLICGDVGYGKTEVALRAAFKAVQEGKQVAVLVPTTILAQQHFNTFKERLEKFPVKVEMMSRFRSADQNKKTESALKSGEIDIVIGTHRLLSKNVGFKDLGLLVIDEEQRFGVAHKEKIKKLKTNVDVISLTATPIPRTLHMSLSGIRDLSVLEEPPFDRVPVQTYVMEYNDEFVREAISREIARKGQVFYVFNRVNGIEDKCTHIRELMPNARVEYAHGQMRERELENIMAEFVNGGIDVLVTTTIVETGLDIPNANTLIIDGAERMGLSQLYQLRGRVGRSSRTAYAFFMYRKDKLLSEEAEKRLKAIREFTEFGAGIKIAMRDLEIRGAGNVLGAEQHGEMQAVGYDLYCKLLSKAVRLMKGQEEEKPDFETGVDCDIDAFIPESYISEEYQKLDIYKRISEIVTDDDYTDMADELTDRFGDMPCEVTALMDIALLKSRAHTAYVTELSIKQGLVVMEMYPKADIDISIIPKLIEKEEGRLKFMTGANPRFMYRAGKGEPSGVRSMMKKSAEITAAIAAGRAV